MKQPSPPIDEIVLAAREMTSPEARAAYLAQACGNDAELRQRVEQLLAAPPIAVGNVPQAPPPGPTVDEAPPIDDSAGTVLGPYKLLQRLGEGGMGEVWVAQQREPVQRLVALKVLKPGLDSRHVLARFEAEEQALALMDHPNIARVFDAGTTPSGRPYFVMELVKGLPITQYCDEHQFTVRQRLELFVPVCQAVQHAHQKGIIHRDLKPSNVLVAEYDATPVVKVIDFGIAKATGGQLTDRTLYTEFGCVVGTLEYMSPEQARLNQLDVDTRSDVYSLGVLLYELLTGTTPLEPARLKAGALDEMLRVIREEEPPRPSTRISTSQTLAAVAARRRTEPTLLARLVRGELDWIALRALEKDRRRRYETASALAEDVQRHLRDEPVQACPPSAAYRLRKFVRRHRLPVLAGAAVLAALLLGVIGTTIGMFRAAANAEAEERARKDAEEHSRRAEAESTLRRRLLYISDMGAAQRALEYGDLERLEMLLRRHVPRGDEEDNRGFEWYYLFRLWKRAAGLARRELPVPVSFSTGAFRLASSGDGSRLAVAYARGQRAVTILDMKGREPPRSFGQLPPHYQLTFVSLTKDGGTLVYPDEDLAGVVIRDLGTGRKKTVRPGLGVGAVALSPDEGTLALGCADGSVRLWDLRAGNWKNQDGLRGHQGTIQALAFVPGKDRYLASAGGDNTIGIWDLATEQLRWKGEGHNGPILDVACSPDGALVAAGCADRTVTVWDAARGLRLHTLVGGRDEARAVAFSPDGTLLAVGCRDFQVRLWDVPEFTEREVISGYNDLRALAFLPDGTLVFGARGGGIALRPADAQEHADIIPRQGRPGSVNSVVFSPDGGTLVSQADTGLQQVRLIAMTRPGPGNREVLPLPCVPGPLAMSPAGLLAVGDKASATDYLYDLAKKQFQPPLTADRNSGVGCVAFSPSGKRLAVGLNNGTVIAWDLGTQQECFHHDAHQGGVFALCFCGDERTLLTGGFDQHAKLWDVEEASRHRDLGDQLDWISATAASGDGGLLAVGSVFPSSRVRLWRRSSLSEDEAFSGHFDAVMAVAFFRDGRTVVTASADRTVRLWDLTMREQRFVFDGGPSIFQSLAFSPDERTLAAGARDGTIRLFRAASHAEIQAEPGWWRLPEEGTTP